MKPFNRKNHSVYKLSYHLIFIVRYRKKLLVGDLNTAMKDILLNIADESDFSIDTFESDIDHLHFVIEAPPKLSPLQIARRLKQLSTTRIWKQFPELLAKEFTKKRTFWSSSYCILSVGEADLSTVQNYVNNQGK